MEENKKPLKLFTTIFFIFIVIGLALSVLWNFSLEKKMKQSRAEREGLRKNIEKVEVLEKASRSFVKDVMRHKAITLCFWELIEKNEKKFSRKDKQDCIQLIVMTDEKYGHKGLDAPLILAWLETESRGNPEAVSNTGAKGLAQLIDYRAWKVLNTMGYPGYDKKLVFNPVVNLTGGLYHLHSLMNYWEWKGEKDPDRILFYALYSYKWGAESAEELFNSKGKANKASNQYINKITKHREKWVKKLKYWVDDAQSLEDKWTTK